METINIKNLVLKLDPINPQPTPLGRNVVLSGVKIDFTKEPKWFNKIPNHPTIYIFKYVDDGSFIGFSFDNNYKFISKLVHKDIIDNSFL